MMALAALSSAFLEYGSHLNIGAGSKILTDVTSVKALMEYLHDAGQTWPHMPAVTVVDVDEASLSPIRSKAAGLRDWQAVICEQFNGKALATTSLDGDVFTHVVFDFTTGGNADLDKSERLKFLKHVQYILQPKGIALLTFGQSDFNSNDEIKELFEDAVFERGRMRITDREGLWTILVMKWDSLYA